MTLPPRADAHITFHTHLKPFAFFCVRLCVIGTEAHAPHPPRLFSGSGPAAGYKQNKQNKTDTKKVKQNKTKNHKRCNSIADRKLWTRFHKRVISSLDRISCPVNKDHHREVLITSDCAIFGDVFAPAPADIHRRVSHFPATFSSQSRSLSAVTSLSCTPLICQLSSFLPPPPLPLSSHIQVSCWKVSPRDAQRRIDASLHTSITTQRRWFGKKNPKKPL